ncbi:extracellular solute-binding protein [Nonomuraea sp. LPB2021202275-12-8]|uniref:extracellular solute-binding protein n=1 Tax=Nonomuraea sp. LPB2021202275-12-8 TaxID=3120159 RepID=UPI00300D1468
MDRRRIPAVALAALAMAVTTGAAGPSPSPSPTGTPSASPTQSDGTLQILTYRGYAEYGGTSPRANWAGPFERETGCRVARLDTVQTPKEMEDKLAERPYDVISAGPALAGAMIEAKQVQPVDTAKIEGYDDLAERLRDLMTDSGTVYGVPFLWGSHEFLYDSRELDGGDVAKVLAADRVMLKDSPLTLADAALADDAVDRPFELTASQLDEAARRLAGRQDRTYWTNPLDLVKGFATGSVDYAQATPYFRMLLQKAKIPVKAVAARKTTGWVDSWMLGANVTDTDCAYRWLNRMTEADTQRDAAAWLGLAPANTKACKGRATSVCEAYGATKSYRLDRIAFAVRPPGDCRPPEGECTDYAAWTERWRELTK